jgi:hypothetical protein
MHRVFAGEGGFEDKELRTMQSTSKRGPHEDPSRPEPREGSVQRSPSVPADKEKAA